MLSRRVSAVTNAAVLAIAPLPLLTLLPRTFVGHLDYAFAPFAAVAAILLARARLPDSHVRWPGKRWFGCGILATAGVTLFFAAVFGSPWAAAMSLILMAGAFAWDKGGRPALRAVVPSLTLLAICIPLPLDLDRTVVAMMSRWSARWASDFLDLLSVSHIRSGQVIAFDGGRADLTAFLGGPFSPFACAAALLVLAQVLHRNWWRTLIVIAIGLAFLPVVTAAAAAAARIAWVGGGLEFLWAGASAGVAMLLAFSFDQWVDIPTALTLKPHIQPADIVFTAPAEPVTGGGAFGVVAAGAFACLALLQAWGIAARAAAPFPAPMPPLPQRIGDWMAERSAETIKGATHVIYRNGDRKMEFSVLPVTAMDGSPVADLEAQGWLVQTPAVSDADPSIVCAKLELPADTFAAVSVCGLTADGRRLAPLLPLSGPAARARTALIQPFGDREEAAAWWVRIKSVTILPPSRRDFDELTELQRRVCDELEKRLRAGGGS